MFITLLAVVLTGHALHFAGAYGQTSVASRFPPFDKVIRGWSGAFLCLIVLAYATKTSAHFSRVWVVSWYALALAGFTATRVGASMLVRGLRCRGRLARTAAIIDLTGNGHLLARRLMQSAGEELRLVGVFTTERRGNCRNGVDDLVALARLFRIDEVFVALSSEPRCVTAPSSRGSAQSRPTCGSVPNCRRSAWRPGRPLFSWATDAHHVSKPLAGSIA